MDTSSPFRYLQHRCSGILPERFVEYREITGRGQRKRPVPGSDAQTPSTTTGEGSPDRKACSGREGGFCHAGFFSPPESALEASGFPVKNISF